MHFQPTGKTFDEFELGEVLVSEGRTVTEADIVNYAGISGDFNQLHMDEEFGKNTIYGGRIAHGALTFVISTGKFNRFVDGTCIAFLGGTFNYLKAVKPGDTLHIEATVQSKRPSSKGKRGVVEFSIDTLNQKGEIVFNGVWNLLLQRK